MTPPTVEPAGDFEPGFAAVRDAFAAGFADGSEVGASLAIEVDGDVVVDLWGGHADAARTSSWTRDTIACVFSCTKGLAAIALLHLVDAGKVDLDAPVATYWPEFAAEGKDTLPVRWLLTHEAGLSAIDRPMPFGSLSDWDAMVDALASQAPSWEPGTGHGYHGVTFGHLVGEVVRLVDGRTIGAYLRDEITDPLGVACFLGLPDAEDARAAEMSIELDPAARTFFSHWGPDDLGPKSFGNPPDCNVIEHTNSRAFRAAEIPSANAHADARALARVYGALGTGAVLSPDLVAEAGRTHVEGDDLVMGLPTRFGLGFEITMPEAEFSFGPGARTFGHNGSGGSLGFLDPDTGVSLGYAMNRMEWRARRDDRRWFPILDALYDAL
ncbi:MAG TPA: serine hydrolase domain-containing protein [Acidimicrobiia bacterium]|nr:serine hydrolase domain-containing protein [Acidimicrobiia bacterium]